MTESSTLYSPLPADLEQHPAISSEADKEIAVDPTTRRFTPKFVCEALEEGPQLDATAQRVYQTKVASRAIPIEKSELKSLRKRRHRQPRNKIPVLTAKQKRAADVHTIPVDCHRYELFEPLHTLWTQYISEVQGTSNSPHTLLPKLLKADLHGSVMKVVRSRCPSYVGTTGIMIMETKNLFRIIDQRNRLISVPKANSVFALSINQHEYIIYGSQFCYRAADRAVKKFKGQNTIDL
ncbi:Rof/RNase P-like protein [Syncephalis plumigaleata]|nr:Rof/RNase P-like protein [Syncephalis plumigaleata]